MYFLGKFAEETEGDVQELSARARGLAARKLGPSTRTGCTLARSEHADWLHVS